MNAAQKQIAQVALGAALFISGLAAGTLHARSAAAQNRFGQPKTVLHVVVYKFRDDVSNYDREKAIGGIKDMAGKIPGIKNIWLKTERNQASDFSGVFSARNPQPSVLPARTAGRIVLSLWLSIQWMRTRECQVPNLRL